MITKREDYYKDYPCKYIDEHFPNRGRVLMIDDGYFLEIMQTIVAAVDSNGWFYVLGLFNHDTQNTLKWFASEYAKLTDWDFIKSLYKDKKKFNINTGEVC